MKPLEQIIVDNAQACGITHQERADKFDQMWLHVCKAESLLESASQIAPENQWKDAINALLTTLRAFIRFEMYCDYITNEITELKIAQS
jgi:hypothetical protein